MGGQASLKRGCDPKEEIRNAQTQSFGLVSF